MRPETILIADRQIHVRNALATRLRTAGYLIAAAGDGMEAYALTRSIRPDLVIADYQLSRLSGPELCAKLACDPLTSYVPVILTTAEGLNAPVIPATNIARVIRKPFSPQLLLNIVRDLLVDEGSRVGSSEQAAACTS